MNFAINGKGRTMKFIFTWIGLIVLLPTLAISMEALESPPVSLPSPIVLPPPVAPIIPEPIFKFIFEGMVPLETISQIPEQGYQKQLYQLVLRVAESKSIAGKISKTQRNYVN